MKKVLFWILSVFFFVLCTFFIYNRILELHPDLHAKVASNPNTFFTITTGESIQKVINRLEQDGLIPSAFLLNFYVKARLSDSSVKAGEYRLTEQSPVELLNQFIDGKVHQYRFTIIEGWSFKELSEAIRKNNAIKINLLNVADEARPKYFANKIFVPYQYIDGAFLPDTYFFERGDTDIQILRRAAKASEDFFISAWAKRSVIVDSFFTNKWQVLSLASLVEKESVIDEERAKIAGVFFERLKRNMRLQSDPTVIYAMGDSYKGKIKKKDLRVDHPANTYVNKGIPPAPIAYPGRESIEAVLHPQLNGDLYFVAKGDGSHAFNKTLEGHNADVRKYILDKK